MKTTLVIHDIATQSEQVLLESEGIFEAPNWHPHDPYLVINKGGLIYRVPLKKPEFQLINTGAITACNNDHGISPNGRLLVISDSPARGTSSIYRLPIDGGDPVELTKNRPSYWHGWSPDGATLAYTAKRGEDFNIFTIPVRGGDEKQVTFGGGHKDGPDYTPDGNWIWFNSDQGGRGAQLWRVQPDGSALEQMTDDDLVNWFPHPSPDGEHILYLAYPNGTEGHPFGRDVQLRMMSPSGGSAHTIASFWGGQGTMNVPNWSPDSKRFAYVRYTE